MNSLRVRIIKLKKISEWGEVHDFYQVQVRKEFPYLPLGWWKPEGPLYLRLEHAKNAREVRIANCNPEVVG